MPSGFGVLDALLIAVPVFLALFGLVRGAPVEFASCFGCVAGAAAAWVVGHLAFVAGLGQLWGPLLCLAAGIVAWRLTRNLSKLLGFDTRWVSIGTVFDSVLGFTMGGIRGLAFVSAACLAYAVVFVPLGLANPLNTVAYPVFLSVGSRVTSAVLTATEPQAVQLAQAFPNQASSTLLAVPLPIITPHLDPAPLPAAAQSAPVAQHVVVMPAPSPATVVTAASLLHVLVPNAVAGSSRPVAAPPPQPDIPVRGVPAWLIETRHNIAHPFGETRRAVRHHF